MKKTTAEDNRKMHFIINCAYYALIIGIAYLVFKYLLRWIMPFIIGFLIAAAVQPAARFINKKRGVSIKFCSVTGVLILVALLLALAGFGTVKAVRDISDLGGQLPSIMDNLTKALKGVSERLSPYLSDIQSKTGLKVDTSLSDVSNQLLKISQLPGAAVGFLQSAASTLPSLFLNIIVTVVSACFIAADYTKVTHFLAHLLPERHRATAANVKDFFCTTVLKLIRAYLTLMFITFCELSVGLALLRIHNPIAIAAVVAIIDILPVLGTGTVLIPWAVIEFIMGNTFLGVGLLLLYIVITIVRNILEPKIVGDHIGLHPLITLTAMIIGLKAIGVIGLIAFPIAVLIIKYLYESGTIKFGREL